MTDASAEPGGLEAIFLAHREPLLRFLRARGATENADDLLQEAWLRAASQTGGPIGNPRSYLFKIANNLMIDHHRAETQRRLRERDWAEVHGSSSVGISDEPGADDGLVAKDMLAKVKEAIDDLGEPTTTIFRRFRLDGIPQKTIAGELAVSLATVEKHLQKAYKAVLTVKNAMETD